MASRPENIGIKAMEVYFPSQVSPTPPDIAPSPALPFAG